MQNSVLYKKLVDATVKIITQFGRSIIHEERFVNILSDLYPERDNPAVLRIIKSLIQDNLLKDVLNANIKNIEHQVATTVGALSKQYGYAPSLVEGILFSLAVGYGTISTAQYNALKALKNKPAKKQTPPSQNNNSNPNRPTKQKNSPNKQPNKYDSTGKKSVILLWGVIGLLASPIVYALQININEWWPMAASVAVAFIQLFTVLPVSFSFDGNNSISKNHTHPALHGGFCALYLFAIVFWIAFPFLWSFEEVQGYWGFVPNKDAFPWILTWFANLFCAMLLGTGLGQNISNLSNNWRQNKGRFSDNFKDLMNNKQYRNGFITVSVFFIVDIFVLYSIPLVKESQYKSKITEYNNKIEAFNQHCDSIRNVRSQTERELSFGQFKLGDTYFSCVSKIERNDEYSLKSKNLNSDDLTINDIDYISIVDTILHVKTNWNNEDLTIKLYFVHQRLIALNFSPQETDGDSLLVSYIAKYGEPESHLSLIDGFECNLSAYEYSLGYSIMEDKLVPEHFFWTYKNALININYYRHRPYSSYAKMLAEGINILYFDRKAEKLLQEHKKEQQRKARASEKRRSDSLRLVREAEERQRQEQRRQEELNHQRSMEQI